MTTKLDFEIDGAVRLERAALSILPALEALLADIPKDRAGVRIYGKPKLVEILLSEGPFGQELKPYIGAQHQPVRAVLFDKSGETNWALGWHQDRTIAVKEQRDLAGFGAWSVKAGVKHVEPPFELIEQMVTARIHLDNVPHENGPLQIVLGSHRLGKLLDREIEIVAAQNPVAECLASAGDVWIYATPIVHASAASDARSRRRVLQIDYAPFDLPGGLEWQGL